MVDPRTGKWYTVGDSGAQFVTLPKGAIVFNHLQTAQLLSNKNTIGRALDISKAYVNGNAMLGGGLSGTWLHKVTGSKTSGGYGSSGGYRTSSPTKVNEKSKENTDDDNWFEREYAKRNHLVAMEQQTQAEYLKWLNDNYKKAYDANLITLEEFYKYQEEVFQGQRDLFLDSLNDIEHAIDMLDFEGGNEDAIVKKYQEMITAVEKEIKSAKKNGLTEDDEYIQQLRDKQMEYSDAIKDIETEAFETAKDQNTKMLESGLMTAEEYAKWLRKEAKQLLKDGMITSDEYSEYRSEAYKVEADDIKKSLEQGKLSISAYNKWVQKNAKDALNKGIITTEEYNEYYKAGFDAQYEAQNRALEKGQLSTEDYVEWLKKKAKEALDAGIITIDQYLEYEDEAFDKEKESFSEHIEEMRDAASGLLSEPGNELEAIERLENALDEVNDKIDAEEAKGKDADQTYIDELKEQAEGILSDMDAAYNQEFHTSFDDLAEDFARGAMDVGSYIEAALDKADTALESDFINEEEYKSALDTLLNAYLDSQRKALDNGEADFETYYKNVTQAAEDAFAAELTTLDERNDTVLSALETLAQEQEEAVDREQMDMADYLRWLESAVDDAYKHGYMSLEQYTDYQAEILDGWKEVFKDTLNDIQSRIDNLSHYHGNEKESVDLYKDMMSRIEDEIDAARDRGLDDNDDTIQDLQQQWWDCYDAIADIEETVNDDAESALEDLIDVRVQMIQQEVENRKDALNDQLDAEQDAHDEQMDLLDDEMDALEEQYDKEKDLLDERLDNLKEFYDKQREMLEDQRDQDDYLKEQTEKRKAVSDLEMELQRLALDDSAWAEKRKEELREELVEAQMELDEFERDHAFDMTMDELDMMEEAQTEALENEQDALDAKHDADRERLEQEKEELEALYEERRQFIQDEIDALEEATATEAELRRQALEDLRNDNGTMLQEMLDWNEQYGSGIEHEITDKWNAAKEALDSYYQLYGEYYEGVQLQEQNAQTHEKDLEGSLTPDKGENWDDNSISDKGSGKGSSSKNPNKGQSSSGSSSSGSSSSGSGSSSSDKNSSSDTQTKWWEKFDSGYIKKGAKVYQNSNTDDVKENPYPNSDSYYLAGYYNGRYNMMHGSDQQMVGWVNKKDVVITKKTPKEYKSGTISAAAGLARVDELGPEYMFTSKDGNKYRVFSGGEKVLNAKATDFLYNFANTGGGVIGNMLAGALRDVATMVTSNNYGMGDIHMGNITINGNANEHTVSEIRRAQRDNVDYLLRQFKKLNA